MKAVLMFHPGNHVYVLVPAVALVWGNLLYGVPPIQRLLKVVVDYFEVVEGQSEEGPLHQVVDPTDDCLLA